MLINLRNALMAGKRKPTAKDYVQSGLVAMWDGIENAGWGVHDPNATEWKDLVGSYDLVQTQTAKITWDDDSCVFALNTDMYNSDFSTGYNAVLNGTWTAECVFSVTSTTSLNASIFGLGGNRTLWIFTNASTTIQSDKLANATLTDIGEGNLGQKNHVVATGDGRVYVNGVLYTQRATSTTARTGDTRIRFGLLPDFYSSGLVGHIFGNRFSTRNFTSAEIAANYAIDKERFGLP